MTRSVWFSVAAMLMFTTLLVVMADLLYFNPRDQRLSPYDYDETMGWLPKNNFSRNIPQKDAAGNKYNAFLSYDRHRFRAYGDPATRKTKILFLGDSYTGDPFTGNKEMYFSVVKSALREKFNKDVELFAVGGGGYGTLQEYLLVKEQLKIIKPDIFVLQFSDNDFMNNLREWESQGIVRNQTFYRPYYSTKSGTIQYSTSPFVRCYKFLYNNSYFFRRTDIIMQRLQYKFYGDYSRTFAPQDLERLEKDSYDVTRQILLLLKNEFSKDAQLFIMIDVTNDKKIDELQVKLAKEAGYIPLLFPMRNLNKFEAENKNAVLRHADGGHLNILGNRILGEGLAEELRGHIK